MGDAEGVADSSTLLPAPAPFDLDGLDLDPAPLEELFRVDAGAWLAETDDAEAWLAGFGDRLPPQIAEQVRPLRERLTASA